MTELNRLVRENVLRLVPYSCARDEFTGESGIFMDANENPYGKLNRYPDPYQKDLKKAVSKFKGVPVERIFLGNGSDEIIDLCFRVFCNPGTDKVLTFTPTYGMYEVSASVNDVNVIRIPLNEEFQIDLKATEKWLGDKTLKLIFICSPNNPTGNSMNYKDIEYILQNSHGIVVIDEAYIDFSDKPSLLKIQEKYERVIVMHTFSKAFGLASVRIGMAFSDPAIIQFFNKLKPPYNISTGNQKAALEKLVRIDEYTEQVMTIRKERERLAARLQKLKLIERVFPSDANFLLVKVKNAGLIYDSLVSKNIIVRNRSSVVDNCLRITVGKKSENDRLINVLRSISV
jgi:histidinol-phosphate aminotransferase